MTNFLHHRLLFAAAFFISCFFIGACENDVNEVKALGEKKTGVDEGKQIDSYLSMNGKMRAHLTAPVLLRYQGEGFSKAEFPKSLHVDFYNDSTKVESQLRADYGMYIENDKKVFLKNNVVAFNIKGDTLYCSELTWDQNTGKFYTDKKVIYSKAYRSNVFIGLNGMDCAQDFSNVHLFNMQPGSYFNVPDSTASDSTKPR